MSTRSDSHLWGQDWGGGSVGMHRGIAAFQEVEGACRKEKDVECQDKGEWP